MLILDSVVEILQCFYILAFTFVKFNVIITSRKNIFKKIWDSVHLHVPWRHLWFGGTLVRIHGSLKVELKLPSTHSISTIAGSGLVCAQKSQSLQGWICFFVFKHWKLEKLTFLVWVALLLGSRDCSPLLIYEAP